MDAIRPNANPSLTPRQREILERIARGRSNPEIAAELGIGFETVKMHVSRILSELDVSSREEAAAWWREGNRPVARLRRTLGWLSLAKVAAAVSAVVVAVGAGAFVVAARGGGEDGKPELPQAGDQATATAAGTATATATVTPTATPVDVGWEAAAAALRFELIDFNADALTTQVRIKIDGSIRETGYHPLIYVIDATGQRQRFNGGGFTNPTATGLDISTRIDAISSQPGTVRIEITPVREYVIPALAADQPTPIWASFDIPFSGYTSPLLEVPLSPVRAKPFAAGQVVLDRIASTENALRVEAHFDGIQELNFGGHSFPPAATGGTPSPELCMDYPPSLFDASGRKLRGGGGGGALDRNGERRMIIQYEPVAGVVTLVYATVECKPFKGTIVTINPQGTPVSTTIVAPPQPTPTPRPAAMTDLEEQRANASEFVEFTITVP
ncbi:hypothetical protein AYO38_09515 [bacterium SCGC AG-212-C10]|nr:hypothetical protein AYO38_09515 [bacterium SCGC AG-212-C10]